MKLNLTFLALMSLLLFGCGSSKDQTPMQDEYEEISVGMSLTEVEKLLGPATNSVDEITGSLKFWHLEDDHVITISFCDDGKILSKDRGMK